MPQNVLAQIWALSDIDNDGRLNTEEFILAGHLCDLGMKGEPMPATLPPLLIPPSMRKGAQAGTPLGIISNENSLITIFGLKQA